MITKRLEVLNELGIHARVASRVVRCARNFKSDIYAKKHDSVYDLKNVTGIMLLNTKYGEIVTIEINGPDEVEAAQAIEQLFAIKFGER
jgi:phosphotransferase system HPr (HPr) family protein